MPKEKKVSEYHLSPVSTWTSELLRHLIKEEKNSCKQVTETWMGNNWTMSNAILDEIFF